MVPQRLISGIMLPALLAIVPTQALVSDDFDCGFDTSVWKTYPPNAAEKIYVNAADENLVLTATSGDEERLWKAGTGDNTAPRAYQELHDDEVFFEVEVGFSTCPDTSVDFQDHGIFVRGVDDNEFIRFSVPKTNGGSGFQIGTCLIRSSDTDPDPCGPNIYYSNLATCPDRVKVVRMGDVYTLYAALPNEDFEAQVSYVYKDFQATGVGIFKGQGQNDFYVSKAEYFKVNFDMCPAKGEMKAGKGAKSGKSGKSSKGSQAEVCNLSCEEESSLVSDDFAGLTLDSNVWTTFNPQSTPISLEDGKLFFDIPSSPDTNMWQGGQNTAPRVYQDLPSDEDFEVEVKFATLPTVDGTQYQDQGIFIRGDDDTKFLRFSSYSDNTKLNLFIKRIDGGSNSGPGGTVVSIAPDRFKVERKGDIIRFFVAEPGEDYNLFFIGDLTNLFGTSFTVSGIGIFSGNGTGGRAFDSKIEYFNVLPQCPEPPPPKEHHLFKQSKKTKKSKNKKLRV